MKPLKAPTGRTLHDIQDILIHATVDQLEAPLEMRDGKYQITPAILQAYGLVVDSSGLIKRGNDSLGNRKVTEGPWLIGNTGEIVGVGGAGLEVGLDTAHEGKIIEIATILCSFKMDATVIDRTCRFAMPVVGLPNCAGAAPTTLITYTNLTLSANEYGYLLLMGNAIYEQTNDAGTHGTGNVYFSMPIHVSDEAILQAKIATNGQAGDKAQLSMIYREIGDE